MTDYFQLFRDELASFEKPVEYTWALEKAKSAQWMIDRIAPDRRGVDVGGTEWLCEQLAAKGCDITYYDIVPPRAFPKAVQAEMMEFPRHFERESLDFITTRHTLEHSLVPLYQLWAYNRALKLGGDLFVIVPCEFREWIWFPSHYNCLPRENWVMLFYRAGFKLIEADAGTWNKADSKYVEYRFHLRVETRDFRLNNIVGWLPF